MSIKVLIVDDHAIVRHGLSRSIQQQEDMEVVGQASDGHSAVDLARQLTPNVVLMDVSMPALNGIEATRAVLRESPSSRVIALSMHSAKQYVREMFRAGASGYLLKDCEFDELVQTIRLIAEGQTYISPSISRIVVENYTRSGTPEEKESAFSVLTQREREVLQLMAEGHSTKQIAMQLFISPKTVEAHRLRIMNKLDIDNVALLTKYAIQEGLTPPEP
ncbi:MAG: response regulator [Solirubrobacterales bacterium]